MALHLTISGLVQGVGYRQWFRRRAEALGLTGWVRNRADGTVEALVVGSREALESLARDAMNGPLGAKVDAVTRTEAEDPVPPLGPGIEIRGTI